MKQKIKVQKVVRMLRKQLKKSSIPAKVKSFKKSIYITTQNQPSHIVETINKGISKYVAEYVDDDNQIEFIFINNKSDESNNHSTFDLAKSTWHYLSEDKGYFRKTIKQEK